MYYIFLLISLGPPHQSTIEVSKASFRHPAGIDVLVVKPGKNEILFVCDKGNSCIRVIKGIHSYLANKFVGTLKICHIPANWKPEGLTVVSKNCLAVCEGTAIFLVCMDATFTGGQLVSVVDNLESPYGLCLSKVPEVVFAADGHTIKQINLETKTVDVFAQGFKQAFDVSLSNNRELGVTEVQAHKVFILEEAENSKYNVQSTIGTGDSGCFDGPSSKAQLSEPTGICFDFDSAIICCFGGSTNGYIKLYSKVDFACNFMATIRQI
jgi:hypothetical protein